MLKNLSKRLKSWASCRTSHSGRLEKGKDPGRASRGSSSQGGCPSKGIVISFSHGLRELTQFWLVQQFSSVVFQLWLESRALGYGRMFRTLDFLHNSLVTSTLHFPRTLHPVDQPHHSMFGIGSIVFRKKLIYVRLHCRKPSMGLVTSLISTTTLYLCEDPKVHSV